MKALIIIDMQNDFLPGGALAVPDGDQVIPTINALMPEYELIIATQDWHPERHGSFTESHPGAATFDVIDLHGLPQTLWPTHCIANTHGAALADALHKKRITKIVYKGTDPLIDSYSGFHDNGHQKSTDLAEYLREKGVTEVHLVGLATDYCVKFTALDALKEGFTTVLIPEACRGVNLSSGDVSQAIKEIRTAGGIIRTLTQP